VITIEDRVRATAALQQRTAAFIAANGDRFTAADAGWLNLVPDDRLPVAEYAVTATEVIPPAPDMHARVRAAAAGQPRPAAVASPTRTLKLVPHPNPDDVIPPTPNMHDRVRAAAAARR